jgi:hypothetical protein
MWVSTTRNVRSTQHPDFVLVPTTKELRSQSCIQSRKQGRDFNVCAVAPNWGAFPLTPAASQFCRWMFLWGSKAKYDSLRRRHQLTWLHTCLCIYYTHAGINTFVIFTYIRGGGGERFISVRRDIISQAIPSQKFTVCTWRTRNDMCLHQAQ